MAFTIAKAQVDVHLDRSALPGELDALAADLEAQGNDSGRRLGRGLSDGTDGRSVARTIAEDLDRELQPRAEQAGDDSGSKLSQGMRQAVTRNSPLIVAGIGAALTEGAPVMIAAATALFAGIAAVAVHNNAQIKAAFEDLSTSVTTTFSNAAQVTVPMFVNAMDRIGTAVRGLGPQFQDAFAALAGPIDSLTTGLIRMTQNVMPGLVSAVRAAGPVFQGLASMLASIGTGLGQFFSIIAQHSSAAGTAFSALGSIIGALLPILGQLVGAGAELARTVLPPLASALHAVSSALNFIAPILPGVLAGFLGFKAVTLLSGPIGTLASKISNLGTVGAAAAGGLGKLQTSLPLIGTALAVVGGAFQMQSQQVQRWGQALLDGGNAADQARQQIQQLQSTAYIFSSGIQGGIADLLGYGTALNVTAQSGKKAQEAARDLYNAMSPLERKQQDVTTATNQLQAVLADPKHSALAAAEASQNLANKQQALSSFQAQVKTATDSATTASQRQQTALQGIADKASAANTQIQLLKGALDALTGANMTADQAEIAVTQAVDAVTQAVKDKTAALSFNNGQLDLSNAKSAQAASLLMTLASNGHQEIATLEQQGASTVLLNQKTDELRNQFIQQAQQLGATAQQAQALADRYFGIPGQVNTTITAYDNASATISRVQGLINGLHDKNIFITTYSRVVSSGPAGLGGAALPQAAGGIVHMFAGGGMEPMRAGMASIVPPNTLRVIGDRTRDDEFYIPDNNAPRSLAIGAEYVRRHPEVAAAAAAQGVSIGSDGPKLGSINVQTMTLSFPNVTTLGDPALPRQLLTAIRDGIRKLEMESR